ncbi:hypothetical protein G3N59_25660 [Paraburkholderia sp. Ac-20340]|uniref:hypothetical protein n=1 Tax=Paraburkholderia sp. Ac-20340 TaxID=2703888 RepID=UPI0019821E71|nr:hypothetical protein [Paraburkholderia sp. Ac-20340]MBN3856771.1 hypothetical protein [Paraburkholderia sp. Ac-20340]
MTEPVGHSRMPASAIAIAVAVAAAISILAACSSPPKPPEPTGQWVPVNPVTAQASRPQQK